MVTLNIVQCHPSLTYIFNFRHSGTLDSAFAYQMLCKLEDCGRSYDVILILQDDGHSVANLLPVSGLATSHI